MKKSFPFAFLLAYLLPGFGHFYLGKRALGIFYFFSVVSLYMMGLALGGGVLWEEMNILTVLAYTVKFFNGLPFLGTLAYHLLSSASLAFNDVGTTFILVSGSLNLLIIINLVDVMRDIKALCPVTE